MRSLGEYFRLYFIIEAQYIKARMQYRADFIISSIGMFFSSLATLGVFWIILQSVPNLAGWSLMEMVFIYAFYMIAISPMQILFDHAWQIRFHVQQGSFLKYYFRPLNMMFYYMSEMFDIKGITQLIVGGGLLLVGLAKRRSTKEKRGLLHPGPTQLRKSLLGAGLDQKLDLRLTRLRQGYGEAGLLQLTNNLTYA